MNISLQDSHNLGWKLGLVAKGLARPQILQTYESERRKVALDLIAFDHSFSRLFSGRPAKDVLDEEGVSMEAFKEAFVKGNLFATGLSVDYGASMLVAKGLAGDDDDDDDDEKKDKAKKQKLATHIPLGMRFPNHKVLNQSSALALPFQSLIRADGRFHLVVFAGDVLHAAQKHRLAAFCAALAASKPLSPHLHSHIRILTLHSSPRVEVELLRDFPEVLRPFDEEKGWDYNAVFVDDVSYHEGGGRAYEGYGVDRVKGCVVVCRPDGYVGWIGAVEEEEVKGLEGYFAGVFL